MSPEKDVSIASDIQKWFSTFTLDKSNCFTESSEPFQLRQYQWNFRTLNCGTKKTSDYLRERGEQR